MGIRPVQFKIIREDKVERVKGLSGKVLVRKVSTGRIFCSLTMEGAGGK